MNLSRTAHECEEQGSENPYPAGSDEVVCGFIQETTDGRARGKDAQRF